jgi:class 3 adenylate cyclase
MKLHNLIFGILLFSQVYGLSAETIDISIWDKQPLQLIDIKGPWDFFPNDLIHPSQMQDGRSSLQKTFPYSWRENGVGTFRLKIEGLQPGVRYALIVPHIISASRIFWNGEKILDNGYVSQVAQNEIPRPIPSTVFIDSKESNEIIIHVSNFHYYKAGVFGIFQIGREAYINEIHYRKDLFQFFFIGSLTIIGIYNLFIFLLRRNDFPPLYFALLALLVAFRTSITEGQHFPRMFPGIRYEAIFRIEYLTTYLGVPIYATLIRSFFPLEFGLAFLSSTYFVSLFFLLSLLFPSVVFSKFLFLFQYFTMMVIIYSIYSMIKAYQSNRDGAIALIVGAIGCGAAVINDILMSLFNIPSVHLTHMGLLFFSLSMAMVIALRYSNTYNRVKTLSTYIQETNSAYSRFVPKEFLNFLNKENITEVSLGDQTQKEMTILFADIRSFTELSEKMSPKENFDFLNAYLKRVGPIVREHNGFIDKFIGDGVMALFPNSPEDAVNCAIKIQNQIRMYNKERLIDNYNLIKVGIGIHTGKLILGVIGENERLEGTVIGDAVNLASRMEGLTKMYDANVLISESTLQKIADPSRYNFRILEQVQVRGKNEPVSIFEVFDGNSDYLVNILKDTRNDFERGIYSYLAKDYQKAIQFFTKVLYKNPGDTPSKLYLEKCRREEELIAMKNSLANGEG